MRSRVESLPARNGTGPGAEVRHRAERIDDVRLHYVEAGDDDAPLVVLLHGFPECWYTWHRQLPALVEAGYRVIALDCRGYNLSEKPDERSRYRMAYLVRDVVDLIEGMGRDEATVVGHDFGGMIAWELGIRYPDVLERLCVLNAPHPAAYRRDVRSIEQLRRSWYAALFQLPRVPEWLLSRDGYRAIRRLFEEGPASPDAFTDDDVERFVTAIARPGALSAALDYYRANRRRYGVPLLPGGDPGPDPTAPIEAPTLLLWGMRDHALSPSLTRGLDAWVPDIEVERVPDASHWVHHDAPERVARELLSFLADR